MEFHERQEVSAIFRSQFESYCDITAINRDLPRNLSHLYTFSLAMSNNGIDFGRSLPYSVFDGRYQSVEFGNGIFSYSLKVKLYILMNYLSKVFRSTLQVYSDNLKTPIRNI